MATPLGIGVAVAAILALVFAAASWGRGLGWVTMILTGIAGLAVAGIAYFFREIVSEETTTGRVELNGELRPIAALDPGTGPDIAILAGVVIATAALAGIVSSLTRL